MFVIFHVVWALSASFAVVSAVHGGRWFSEAEDLHNNDESDYQEEDRIALASDDDSDRGPDAPPSTSNDVESRPRLGNFRECVSHGCVSRCERLGLYAFWCQKHTLHNYRVHSEGFCLHPTLRLDHIDGVTFNTTVTPMVAALGRPSATVFVQLVTTLQRSIPTPQERHERNDRDW